MVEAAPYNQGTHCVLCSKVQEILDTACRVRWFYTSETHVCSERGVGWVGCLISDCFHLAVILT